MRFMVAAMTVQGLAFLAGHLAANVSLPRESLQLQMKVVGHRGASDDAPENTLRAVREAWEQDADGVEVDVHLTKDGQIVVLHDATLQRTTGVAGVVGQTILAEIKTLEAGSWKAERFRGEAVPILSEVLSPKLTGTDKTLFIELKSGGSKLVGALSELLRHYEFRRAHTVIIGFDHALIDEFKKLSPSWRAFYLTLHQDSLDDKLDILANLDDWQKLQGMIERAKKAGVDGINFQMSRFLTKDVVAYVRGNGLEVAVWTLREDDTFANAFDCLEHGVGYFTTNRPGHIKTLLPPL